MKNYRLIKEQIIDTDMHRAWEFFSNPQNLSVITPPEMRFRILGKKPFSEIKEGLHLHYVIQPLFNIPIRWTTLISQVDAPNSFTDIQLRGPYKSWEHKHTFTIVKEGILMIDEVTYQLPFGWLGRLGHGIVRKKLENIFDFRREIIDKTFNPHANILH